MPADQRSRDCGKVNAEDAPQVDRSPEAGL